MTIQEWQEAAHKNVIDKGFWDNPKTDIECIALMITELTEAIEEIRTLNNPIEAIHGFYYKKTKPEGELIELADCVLRILDYCEAKGYDLEGAMKIKYEYNKTRPYLHGKKL